MLFFKYTFDELKKAFILGLLSTASAQSVLDVPCTHKYSDCGPLNAICDCDPVEANFDCTSSVGATCECDATQRMYPVVKDTVQTVNGQSFTTICELLSGNRNK